MNKKIENFMQKHTAILRKSNIAVLILFASIIFALLSRILMSHSTTFFTNLDNVDQFYTWYQKLSVDVHQGILPIWNTNVFSGQSFAGEIQPGVFYPINLVWVAIFGSSNGISLLSLDYLVSLHFLMGAFGFYLLARQLKAKWWSSFLTGLLFTFSGMVAFRSISQTAIFFGFTLIPYPIYFYAKLRSSEKNLWKNRLFTGISLGMTILSGHINAFYFAVLAIVIYELVYNYKKFHYKRNVRTALLDGVKSLTIVFVFSLITAIPQLYISGQYLPRAYRIQASGYAGPKEKIGYGEHSKSFNLDMHEFANMVDPVTYQVRDGNNIFIGLVPLGILILVWLIAGDKLKKTQYWKENSTFASSLLVFSTVCMLGYISWFAVILYEIPLVYQIRQLGRYSLLFHFGLLLLLVPAIEIITRLKLSKKQKIMVSLAGIYLLINAVYLYLLRQYIFSIHHAMQTALLGLLLLMVGLVSSVFYKKLYIGILIILTAFVNTYWFLPKITPSTKTSAVYQTIPSALTKLIESTNGKYRVEIADNSLPINVGNIFNVQTTWGYAATVYAPYFEAVHKSEINQDLLNDMLGVQMRVQKQKPASGQEVLYTDEKSGVYIVKRPTALSKFFTTENWGSLDRKFYQSLDVETITYNDKHQSYSVRTTKKVNAIISEISYKGWVAKVDGKPVMHGTYNIAGKPLFKTIDLEPGTHTVELTYKPFALF